MSARKHRRKVISINDLPPEQREILFRFVLGAAVELAERVRKLEETVRYLDPDWDNISKGT